MPVEQRAQRRRRPRAVCTARSWRILWIKGEYPNEINFFCCMMTHLFFTRGGQTKVPTLDNLNHFQTLTKYKLTKSQ